MATGIDIRLARHLGKSPDVSPVVPVEETPTTEPEVTQPSESQKGTTHWRPDPHSNTPWAGMPAGYASTHEVSQNPTDYVSAEVLKDTSTGLGMLQRAGAPLSVQLAYINSHPSVPNKASKSSLHTFNVLVERYNSLEGEERFKFAQELGLIPFNAKYQGIDKETGEIKYSLPRDTVTRSTSYATQRPQISEADAETVNAQIAEYQTQLARIEAILQGDPEWVDIEHPPDINKLQNEHQQIQNRIAILQRALTAGYSLNDINYMMLLTDPKIAPLIDISINNDGNIQTAINLVTAVQAGVNPDILTQLGATPEQIEEVRYELKELEIQRSFIGDAIRAMAPYKEQAKDGTWGYNLVNALDGIHGDPITPGELRTWGFDPELVKLAQQIIADRDKPQPVTTEPRDPFFTDPFAFVTATKDDLSYDDQYKLDMILRLGGKPAEPFLDPNYCTSENIQAKWREIPSEVKTAMVQTSPQYRSMLADLTPVWGTVRTWDETPTPWRVANIIGDVLFVGSLTYPVWRPVVSAARAGFTRATGALIRFDEIATDWTVPNRLSNIIGKVEDITTIPKPPSAFGPVTSRLSTLASRLEPSYVAWRTPHLVRMFWRRGVLPAIRSEESININPLRSSWTPVPTVSTGSYYTHPYVRYLPQGTRLTFVSIPAPTPINLGEVFSGFRQKIISVLTEERGSVRLGVKTEQTPKVYWSWPLRPSPTPYLGWGAASTGRGAPAYGIPFGLPTPTPSVGFYPPVILFPSWRVGDTEEEREEKKHSLASQEESKTRPWAQTQASVISSPIIHTIPSLFDKPYTQEKEYEGLQPEPEVQTQPAISTPITTRVITIIPPPPPPPPDSGGGSSTYTETKIRLTFPVRPYPWYWDEEEKKKKRKQLKESSKAKLTRIKEEETREVSVFMPRTIAEAVEADTLSIKKRVPNIISKRKVKSKMVQEPALLTEEYMGRELPPSNTNIAL